MSRNLTRSSAIHEHKAGILEKRWQLLCARYLPLAPRDSIWRYHCVRGPHEPARGWKLHVTATILNAGKVLERIGPFLANHGVQFKAPGSLKEIIRINCGLYYGYSQVGKIFTVYPRTSEEAVSLGQGLHKLTSRMAGPTVPFDLKFIPSSNVYYRYGAFKRLEIEHPNGRRTPAMFDLNGELVPDLRESEDAKPKWVSDPFEGLRRRSHKRKFQSSQAKRFRIFRALTQRGKGGVYQALDLNANPPRLCLLKEGRKYGELTWDGRDGCTRVRNEEQVLSMLRANGINVPRVYSSFELEGNYYLVTEFVEGESLHKLLSKLRRRMPISSVLRYGLQLSAFLAQMHEAGWIWRDCKPMNIVVTRQGGLIPLDFEGACPVDQPDPMLWGTPGFTPPEWRDNDRHTGLPDDLYALGSILYLLLTGRVPEATDPLPVEKVRREVPANLSKLVMRLLSSQPEQRPTSGAVLLKLKSIGSPEYRRRTGH